MTEHTKLPWRVEQDTDLIWGACNPDDSSTYGMGYSIVQGRYGSWSRGQPDMNEREANAAFIVKACNSHDALVKALNDLHVWCEVEGCGDQAELIIDAFKAAGITEHRCANCDGLGEWDEGPLAATSSSQISPDYRHMVCNDCEGKGTIAISSNDGGGAR